MSDRKFKPRWWEDAEGKLVSGMPAVMELVEAMKPELRRRREQDQRRPVCDLQFDRDRDLDERGLSAADAWSDEHPLQSSGSSRRY